MSLPPPPNTHIATLKIDGQDVKVWDESQMKAYGQQCREAALEESASVCITTADARATPYSDGYNTGAIDCTKAVRRLK